MKKWTAIILLMFLFIGFIGPKIPAQAAAGDNTPKHEVTIISLQHKDPLFVNKDIKIQAHVQKDDPKNPSATIKDENKAMVYAFFTKGKDSRQVQLALTKNGKYEGSIKLPTTGKWKVNVMAIVPDPSYGNSGTDTMETTWTIEKAHVPLWVWIVGVIAAVLIIGLIIFFIKATRKRKARIKAEKQARLHNKKSKKSKKRH
ncbi:MAG: hypothetical protein ACO1OC_01925 [Tuberibacillus sp.]